MSVSITDSIPPNANLPETLGKKLNFACECCRAGKRKCDGKKPICSLCERYSRICTYSVKTQPRKRKYWDEEYVHALEDKVQSLMALLQASKSVGTDVTITGNDTTTGGFMSNLGKNDKGARINEESARDTLKLVELDSTNERSDLAMEELGVMMWRTNLGDGVSLHDENIPLPTQRQDPRAKNLFLPYAQDTELVQHFAALFLDYLNPLHQFVTYNSLDFLDNLSDQTAEILFLHCAILGAGAAFSSRDDAKPAGDAFRGHAESLAFQCCRDSPSLAVVQGLCILTWYELSAGCDNMAWMYVSMAAATAVYLRLHVLALAETSRQSNPQTPLEIRTFWTFYFVDRAAVSMLGRNCALPWRRVNVPSFESIIGNSELATIEEISFAYQCKLWYLHDQFMDQIYASNFETLPALEQSKIFIAAHEALACFYRSYDNRLQINDIVPSKAVLLFHMAYQMAVLLLHPPFLKTLTTKSSSANPNIVRLTLRSITAAASTMTRLVQTYVKVHSYNKAPPLLIHHMLSASLVHLMNSTCGQESLRRQSIRALRLSIQFLEGLQISWPARAGKAIRLIQILAHRWNVVDALPLRLSFPLESTIAPRRITTAADAVAIPSNIHTPPVLANLAWDREHDLLPTADFEFTLPNSDLGLYDFFAGAGIDQAGLSSQQLFLQSSNLEELYTFDATVGEDCFTTTCHVGAEGYPNE